MSDNGIIVNWKSAQKPVDDKPTFQDLALQAVYQNRDVCFLMTHRRKCHGPDWPC